MALTNEENENNPIIPEVVDEGTSSSSPPEGALVLTGAAGLNPILELDDDEFEVRLEKLERGVKRVREIQRRVMEKGVDFGLIPGTQKPTLLKPGAERLNQTVQGVPHFETGAEYGDGEKSPPIKYTSVCRVIGSDGGILGVGTGTANSWETKHRYRRAPLICPECGEQKIFFSRKSKTYFCSAREGGCGKGYGFNTKEAKELRSKSAFEENKDPFDLDNTLCKMAEKRAHVAASLRASFASGIFTQDMEDAPRGEDPADSEVPGPEKQTKRKAPAKRKAAPAAKTGAREDDEPESSKGNGEDVKQGIPVPSLADVKTTFREAGFKTVGDVDKGVRTWSLFEIEDRMLDGEGFIRLDNLNEGELLATHEHLKAIGDAAADHGGEEV